MTRHSRQLLQNGRSTLLAVAALAVLAGCKTGGTTTSGVREAQASDPSDKCAGAGAVQGDPWVWMTTRANQTDLDAIFDCAPPSTATPVGFGHGKGSVRAADPLWNKIQGFAGSVLWGGKCLGVEADGATYLLNLMQDNNTWRYRAKVVVNPTSVRDHQPTVVLDYRIDNTVKNDRSPLWRHTPAQEVVDKIIHGVRDEIREVVQDGVGTHVFIGRAYLAKKALIPLANLSNLNQDANGQDPAVYNDPNTWFLGANFYLDFRTPAQGGPAVTAMPPGSACDAAASDGSGPATGTDPGTGSPAPSTDAGTGTGGSQDGSTSGSGG